MAKLKIIEASYYTPDNTKIHYVTKDLIQMIDFDNDKLFYDGKYNDIFIDPAEGIKKNLKIIFEYDGHRYTKVYKENKTINLPDDILINSNNSRGSNSTMKDATSIVHNEYVLGDKLIQTGPNSKQEKKMSKERGWYSMDNPIIYIIVTIIVALIFAFISYYKNIRNQNTDDLKIKTLQVENNGGGLRVIPGDTTTTLEFYNSQNK